MKFKNIALLLCAIVGMATISLDARRGGGMRGGMRRGGGRRGGIGRAAGPRRMGMRGGMRRGGWSGGRRGGRRPWRRGRRYYGPSIWWGGPYYGSSYYCPEWHPDYPYCNYYGYNPGFGVSFSV